MKTRDIKMKLLTLTLTMLILVNVFVGHANAQNPSDSSTRTNRAAAQQVTVNSEYVKTCEAAIAMVDHLQRTDKLSKDEIAAYKKKVEALESYAATLEAINAKYADLDANSQNIRKIDDKIIKEFHDYTEDLKQKITTLEIKLEKSRSLHKWFFTVGLIVGAGAVAALKSN